MEVSLLIFQCCDTYHKTNNPGREIFSGETEMYHAAKRI